MSPACRSITFTPLATVRLHLKNAWHGEKLRQDEVSILAKFSDGRGKRFEVRPGEKIIPKYWDDQAREVKSSHPDHKRINGKLATLRTYLLKLYDDNPGIAFQDFKALALGKGEKKSLLSVAFDKFLAQQKADRSPKTLKVYNSFKNVLDPFLHLSFKDLNYNFFDKFKEATASYSQNTRHTYLALLKCFLNWCIKRKYQVDMDFKEWKIPTRRQKNLTLTLAELHRLTNTMMSGTAAIGRDYLCFECYTGQRISDIESFNQNDLNGNVWTFNRKKGDSIKIKTVTVDMVGFFETALAILKKYDYTMPKLSRPTIGKYIREACRIAKIDTPTTRETKHGIKTAPKWQFITSHVGRKTAITILLQFGFTTDEVMDMVGIDSYSVMKHYVGDFDRTRRRKRLIEMGKELREKPKKAKNVKMKVV